MAKFNPIIGTLSGKLGGSIYAFNQSGPYVRSYVKQSYPNTTAQQNAKYYFGLAISDWAALSDSQKSEWNTFATNLYSPLNPKKGVKFSAWNAYMGLYTTTQSANHATRHFSVKFGSTTQTFTSPGYIPLVNPPAYRLDNSLQCQNGQRYNITMLPPTVAANGTFTSSFSMNITYGKSPQFTNYSQSEYVGFMWYVSKGLSSTQTFYKNNRFFALAATPPLSSINTSSIPSWNNMTFTFSSTDISPTYYKYFISSGQKIRVTSYLVSGSGQKALIGSSDIIVT